MRQIVNIVMSKLFLYICLVIIAISLLINWIWGLSVGFDFFVIMLFASTFIVFMWTLKVMSDNYFKNKK